jgi:hypothetical protein
MRQITLAAIILLSVGLLNAQDTLIINGKIKGEYSNVLYSTGGDMLTFVKPDSTGSFQIRCPKENGVMPFKLETLTPKRRLKSLTPTLWLTEKEYTLTLDMTTSPFQISGFGNYANQELSETIEKARKRKKLKIIEQHLDKLPAIYFLNEIKGRVRAKRVQKLSEKIPPEITGNVYAKRISTYTRAKAQGTLKKGKKVENFSLYNKSEEKELLFSTENKMRLVAFLGTGCFFSIRSIAGLAELNEIYGSKVEFIAVFTDKTYDIWQNKHAKEKNAIAFKNLWDKYGYANALFNVRVFPSFYLIDEQNKIVQKIKGLNNDQIREALEEFTEN